MSGPSPCRGAAAELADVIITAVPPRGAGDPEMSQAPGKVDAMCRRGHHEFCVVPEPAVELGPQTEFDPDLVVVRMDQIGGAKFTEPPLLVVEIRSPSTALIDLNRKKAAARSARTRLPPALAL
jgi:Uma2 family endonuclease